MTISNRPEPPSAAVESSVPALGAQDVIGISLLVVVLLLVAYFRARHRMFWGDEIMGWIVLRQPNFHSLLQTWRFGIDSSGIWFYVFGRIWMSFFGASELTLRMFSATGIAASAAVIWIASRRYYGVLPVAAGVTFVYSVLAPLRWQLVNGRTYGVFMFAAALVLYLLLRGEDAHLRSPRLLFLLVTFAAYSLLAGSHILGSIYVGAFLGMQLALDLYSRRFRPLLYLSALCSLVVVWFSRANIASTAALGKPTFWTQPPVFKQLLTQSVLFGHRLAAAIAIVFLITLLHLHFVRRRSAIYVIFAGFATLDLAIFALSRFATSIYFDRYVLPFAFAAVLLLAELFTQLREANAPWLRLRTTFPVLYLLVSCAALTVHRLQQLALPADNYTGRLLAQLPPGLPVVDADAATFVELEFYRHNDAGRRLLYPTDWAIALDPANLGGVSGLHEMENWKAEGIDAPDILPTADVLATTPNFVLIADEGSSLWRDHYLTGNPRYSVSPMQVFHRPGIPDLDIWVVHTR